MRCLPASTATGAHPRMPSGALPVPTSTPLVSEDGDRHAVAWIYPVAGACDGLREPPQIECPPVVYPRHVPPAPPVQHGDRLRSTPSLTSKGSGE